MNVGQAFVEIRPDLSGFSSTLNREVSAGVSGVSRSVQQGLSGVPGVVGGIGASAGRELGDGFTRDSAGGLRNAKGQLVKESDAIGRGIGTSVESGLRSSGGIDGTAKLLAGVFAVDQVRQFAGSVIGAASTFQSSMSGIKAVTGATASEFEALRKKALELGQSTVFSASEAAGAIEELAKAGVPLPDILTGAADAAVLLAAAGGVDLKSAATIASNALNQFGLSGKDMAKVADLIAGAANASAIDVGEFGYSLQQVGAVARTVGLSFDDTAVAIAALGNAGIVGSDAGTSLKTMLSNLQPSTKQQTALFRELGLVTASGANQFFDAQGKVKSLAQISEVLQQALAGQTDAQKQANLETLFGSDAIRAAAVLSREGAAGINELAESMGKVGAADVAKTRLDNFGGALEELKGSLETVAIQVGGVLLPGLTTLANFVSGNLTPILAGLTAAFGYVAVAALNAQRAAIAAWVSAAAPFALIAAAIAAVVAIFVVLYQKVEPVRTAVDGLVDDFQTGLSMAGQAIESLLAKFDRVKAAFTLGFKLPDMDVSSTGGGWFDRIFDAGQAAAKAGAAIQAAIDVVKQKLSDALSAFSMGFQLPDFDVSAMSGAFEFFYNAGQTAKNAWDSVVGVVKQVIEVLGPELSSAFQFVQEKAGEVGRFLAEIWPQVSEAATHVFNVIRTVVESVMAVLGPIVEGVVTVITSLWEHCGDDVLSAISRAFNAIKGVISGVLDVVMGIIRTVLAVINGDWGKAWEGVKQVFTGVWDAIFAIVSGAGGILKSLLGVFAGLGQSIIEGIWAGLKAAGAGLWGLLKGLFDTVIIQPFKKLFGINSPSTLFAEFGGWLIEGLINGIKAVLGLVGDIWNTIKETCMSAAGAIKDAIGAAWDWVVEKVRGVLMGLVIWLMTKWVEIQLTVDYYWNAVKELIGAAWDWIVEKVHGVLDAVVQFISDRWNTMKEGVQIIWDWVSEKIGAVWEWIKSKITDTLGAIVDWVRARWEEIKLGVQIIWDWISNKISTTWQTIKDKVSGAIDAVKLYLAVGWQVIQDKTREAFDAVRDKIQSAWDTVVQKVRDAINWVKDHLSQGWDIIKGKTSEAWESIKRAVTDKLGSVVSTVSELPDKARDALSSIGTKLLDAGKSLIQGFIDGIREKFKPVQDALGELTDKLPSWKGPPQKDRTLLKNAGVLVMQGFISGIESQRSAVRTALESVSDDVAGTSFGVSAPGFTTAQGSQRQALQSLVLSMEKAGVQRPVRQNYLTIQTLQSDADVAAQFDRMDRLSPIL